MKQATAGLAGPEKRIDHRQYGIHSYGHVVHSTFLAAVIVYASLLELLSKPV
ncbi:hypothetical protein [Nitrosovibrio sp. Nv4]|uniref:hypothetical protein n=1 Tax=Nitrosovibrio sp. Nv4 TaxID=1945880 RepID=UPI00135C5755|nr:hypothetical protein [Nitrosovibrio sp. Nv4]